MRIRPRANRVIGFRDGEVLGMDQVDTLSYFPDNPAGFALRDRQSHERGRQDAQRDGGPRVVRRSFRLSELMTEGMSMLNRMIHGLARSFVTLGVGRDARPDGNSLLESFLVRCHALNAPRVLELGTKRSIASRSTRHDTWVPHASEYLDTDFASGLDVDIVADVHRLTAVTGEEQFDIIISCSTFEHFKYPHRAAHEVMKALRVGGLLFIQTHQSFPLHAHPYDYFRFSREALAGLFGTQMGFRVLATD